MARLFVGKDDHRFAAAHMTLFPDGTKEQLHGHNFQSSVWVDVDDEAFVDLYAIRNALRAEASVLHRRLLLAEKAPSFQVIRDTAEELEFRLAGKRYVVPRDEVVLLPIDNVTCERLAAFLARRVADRLIASGAPGVRAIELRVEESQDQGAAYALPIA